MRSAASHIARPACPILAIARHNDDSVDEPAQRRLPDTLRRSYVMSERLNFERFLTAATASTAALSNQENKILSIYSSDAARWGNEGTQASTSLATH